MHQTDVVQLERDLYRAAVDDGVWDIVLGLALLVLGGSIAAGYPVAGPLTTGVIAVIAPFVRRAIGQRAGYVRLQQSRRDYIRRSRKVLSITTLAITAALVLAGSRGHGLMKAGLLLSTSIAFAAYLFQLTRFYLYAIVIPITIMAVVLADARGEWALIVSGALILVSGVVVLVRFLHPHRPIGEHPLG